VCIKPERNVGKSRRISLQEIPLIWVIEIPQTQGVHGKSKSKPDKAQEQKHFKKCYQDPGTHSLEEAKTEYSKT
jgi:hypothetical protein